MELQQFRYFLEAARYENLTRAAEELHIAQPALSQSIHRLESELGVQLFDRKSHRITLNEQGKLLEKRLSSILLSIDHLKDELWESLYSSERTIYLNFYSASPFITNCIIAYRRRQPDVKFQVSQLEMTEACDIHIYSQSALPLAVRHTQRAFPEGAVQQEILREEIFLAVAADSPLAQRKSVDLRELREEGYIRLGNSWQLRGICDDFCRRAGVRPKTIFESNSPESIGSLIGAGLGIGFWPEKTWGGEPKGNVALVPIRYPVCGRELVITKFQQGERKPVVDEFFEYMCEYFRTPELEESGCPEEN